MVLSARDPDGEPYSASHHARAHRSQANADTPRTWQAIENGKKIQLLVEEESRFFPFDMGAWRGGNRTAPRAGTGEVVVVPPEIAAAIDAALPDLVPYRRRDYEASAMVSALCSRNGITIPPRGHAGGRNALALRSAATVPARVYIISAPTGAAMATALKEHFAAVGGEVLLEFVADVDDATHVLVLLSKGVLSPASVVLLSSTVR